MAEKESVDLWTLGDLCTPWCVHVAATLRLAEHIRDGKAEIGDLAAAAGCDPYALHRMLTYLVGKGMFEEPSPGRFTLNQTARGLLNPIRCLSFDLDSLGGRFARAWSTLARYVKTGKPSYEEEIWQSFWDDLDSHAILREGFDAMMGPDGHGMPNPEFQLSGGWDSIRTIVDVGGGTGAMLAAILEQHPGARGILLDLPVTASRSMETFRSAGLADRVTVAGQSFFEALPAGADLYVLRKVLNDWPDREAAKILSRCAEAARPNGRIVIIGGVVPDGAPMPLAIEMLLVGGRQRAISEFRSLASAAGLEVAASGPQSAGSLVVECRPR